MPDVSREEFDALVARVKTLEGTPPKAIGLQLKATPVLGGVKIDWTPTIGKPVSKFEAGRDGFDMSGSGLWKGTFVATTRTTTFNKLLPELYKLTVKVFYVDGTSEEQSVFAQPLAPPTVPVETTGRGVLSGLPFDLTIFNGGASNAAQMKALGAAVGVPSFDGILTFMTRGSGWTAARDNQLAADAKAVLDAGGKVIWSLPHSMDGDANMNTIGARNGYFGEQQELARWMAANGLNHPNFILRPDWESNGSWYPWSIHSPGGVQALGEALFWMLENFDLSGMHDSKWDLCLNISDGGVECTWKDIDTGKLFDIYTIDQYDAWPGVTSRAIWEQKMMSFQSLRNCIVQAREAGKLAGIDEGGPWHTSDGAGDNPLYFSYVLEELMKDPARISHWNIYNDQGAPANLFHDFGHNPKAYAQLQVRLKALLRK